MAEKLRWVLLAYRLPREPSTPRIALWRRLKRLGAVQIVDGLVALPFDSRTREQLEWAGQDVLDANGEATVWIGELGSFKDERILMERIQQTVKEEYRGVIGEVRAARRRGDPIEQGRTLARLRREMHRIAQRDYFPPSTRKQALEAIDKLALDVETYK